MAHEQGRGVVEVEVNVEKKRFKLRGPADPWSFVAVILAGACFAREVVPLALAWLP